MIPVSLHLRNFLSYGEAAPVLDFEAFHVACLSGRNGQGKSALLDAITWALWGEARKSSGSHKPDEQLMRIGSLEMQVEFVFDMEGDRYRVIRSFRKSASGKTPRPGLEVQILDEDRETFRPLTSTSMRETQARIDQIVGLDYETFINASFLLQGRSDEFTKKRPSERKEILSRILDLARYDSLYDLAAVHERDARKEEEQAGLDIDRLQEALSEEAALKLSSEDIAATLKVSQQEMDALRAEEKKVLAQITHLEGVAREAEGVRQELETLTQHLTDHERDAASLRLRIQEAEGLLARREIIQQDHQRYLTLQKERDELDEKQEMFRGLEKQLERREAERKERVVAIERKLDKLRFEIDGHNRILLECETKIAERAVVLQHLEGARKAETQLAEMAQVKSQRLEWEERVAQLQAELKAKKDELGGRIAFLKEQVLQETTHKAALEVVKKQQETLYQQLARKASLQEQLEGIQKQGSEMSGQIAAFEQQRKSFEEELQGRQEQKTRILQGDEGTCPTCGTILTATHRKEVAATLETAIATLQKNLQETNRQAEKLEKERDRLRGVYSETHKSLIALDAVEAERGKVDEQVRNGESALETIRTQKQEIHSLQTQLDSEAFEAPLQTQIKTLQTRLEGLPFDEKRYETLWQEASQRARYEERWRDIEETLGRKEQLQKEVENAEREATRLRTQLDDGTATGDLPQQIARIKDQIAQVGFDGERFRLVRKELETLADAGSRMTDLVNAQQNQEAWRKQLENIQQRIAQTRENLGERGEKLKSLEQTLLERPRWETQKVAIQERCQQQEERLKELHLKAGQLAEKLNQLRRDKEKLALSRKLSAEAIKRRSLYQHLKKAFSKHGIPSLIIEQTLPEIEDRTNDLLERLSDGKMQIHLESLKDKKSGGTMETLEITITDEQGVSRPYETFSGGEGFRVNFALRIALSQLLAERSGVRIRTLVVDEGFGTQDEQGVQSLIEAIQIIQDDFDKILVITHLSEMKEAFPVRIEVEKDPVVGSRFSVIGV